MNDDAEVDGLIRREIQARNFFLLCDSENAKASRWVQEEVKIIKSQSRKVFASLDLGAPWEEQERVVETVSIRIRVYISAAAVDRVDAELMADALERADYGVVKRQPLQSGADWTTGPQEDINEAMSNGLFLVLLSPERLTQEEGFHWFELNHALRRAEHFAEGRPTIIPVVLRDYEKTMDSLSGRLREIHALNLSYLEERAKAEALVEAIDQLAPKIDV